MVDLNSLLTAVINAEASMKAAEADVAEAQDRRQMAAEALAREQAAFDAAVADARTLARPSAAVLPIPAEQPASVNQPETLKSCDECGQPMIGDHVCRRMEGAPGPLPRSSPAHSGFLGPMPELGFAPEDMDDREENTGTD